MEQAGRDVLAARAAIDAARTSGDRVAEAQAEEQLEAAETRLLEALGITQVPAGNGGGWFRAHENGPLATRVVPVCVGDLGCQPRVHGGRGSQAVPVDLGRSAGATAAVVQDEEARRLSRAASTGFRWASALLRAGTALGGGLGGRLGLGLSLLVRLDHV